jgi:autophagy-related protein 9
MHGLPNFLIWILVLYLIYRIALDLIDVLRLKKMHDFYLYLLEVPDSDMQTISWQEIIARLMALRDVNPMLTNTASPELRHWYMGQRSKQRLDAHDICNRLMRRENYLIAMFNKEILDLTLPIPFLRNKQIFSRTIEWNLNFCIMDFIFNEEGQLQPLVLQASKRRQLSDALRSRFLFAGFMNILFAPIIVTYTLVVYFFQYFNEYHKNPAALGSRQYTPLACWKFREFNELPHLFTQRINMSYPFAERYVEQFPKIKFVETARFVAFVSGALVSVLMIASILDPELFLGFEVTQDRTVLFYVGVLGAAWAAAHGAVPEDHVVYNPEYTLQQVLEYTRYYPKQWEGRLHSDIVKREFAELYQLKLSIFLQEVLSIIFTPLILWFSLPAASDRIIDFFREFTIHVDGLGHICSFAHFDFQKGVEGSGRPRGASSAAEGAREEYYATKHGKMAASYYGFMDNYATNPKTGIPGYVPPVLRQQHSGGSNGQFNLPPQYPGLMSPTLPGDPYAGMAASRAGRTPGLHKSRSAAEQLIPQRTPRFPAVRNGGVLASPMPSMLLDPHHQPSATGFGGGHPNRSTHHGHAARSKYKARDAVPEDSDEDDRPPQAGDARAGEVRSAGGNTQRRHEEPSALDESVWQTSPQRSAEIAEPSAEKVAGDGMLGLLYQFQKAQTGEGRGGAL